MHVRLLVLVLLVLGSVGFTPKLAQTATIVVTWVDNSDNEEFFQVERKLTTSEWTTVSKPAANVITYTDTVEAKSACYRISAGNEAGISLPSKSACTIPLSPGGLKLELRIPFSADEPTP